VRYLGRFIKLAQEDQLKTCKEISPFYIGDLFLLQQILGWSEVQQGPFS
jgi:hypothetical protein